MKALKRFVMILLISGFMFLPLLAQSVNAQIDEAVSKKSPQEVTKVLSTSKNTASVETYILKKAKDLVAKGDLDLALSITLCVVDFDMDNFEALELYGSIDKQIKKRNEKNQALEAQAAAKAAAEKEAAAAAAEAKAKKEAKKRESNRKLNANQIVKNDETGEIVYIDQDFNNHYSRFSLKVDIGALDLTYIRVGLEENLYTEIKYGCLLNTNVFYHGDNISVGVDLCGEVGLLNFLDSATKDYMISGLGSVQVAVPALTDLFFLNAGYYYSDYLKPNNNISGLPIMSPVIGFTVRDVHFGSIYFETSANYYLSSIWEDSMDAAFDFSFNFFFSLVDLGKVDAGLSLGAKYSGSIVDSNLQNRARVILGIEVFSNE